MAKQNPLDQFVQRTTTNDFRVPQCPKLSAFVSQHGFAEGLRKYDEAQEEARRQLESAVNARLQPKSTPDPLGGKVAAAAEAPQRATSSTVVNVSSGGFPGYSFSFHKWLDAQWQGALLDFVLSLLPKVKPVAVTALLVQFYCADTGKWHTVRQLGFPSTWDIDGVGVEFPDPACDHAFVSYQYPCPDTGNWHTVSLVGSPPTWSIDETGVPVPGVNIDLAFGTKALYNPDMEQFVTVGLAGVPPTWTYS